MLKIFIFLALKKLIGLGKSDDDSITSAASAENREF